MYEMHIHVYTAEICTALVVHKPRTGAGAVCPGLPLSSKIVMGRRETWPFVAAAAAHRQPRTAGAEIAPPPRIPHEALRGLQSAK